MKTLAKVADQCRQLLTQQQISASSPGPILSDIQTLIESIGIGGLRTRSHKGNLPAAVLSDLNARFRQPIEVNLNRPLLRDYPNIAGLYVLLRVMDLARTDEHRVWINEQALALWSGLNPAEQYFVLLEAWLIHADGQVFGAKERRTFSQFTDNLMFLARHVSSAWKTFDEMCHVYECLKGVSTWNTQLQVEFGLIEIQPRPLEGRRGEIHGWLMEKARRTPWGGAVAWAILEFLLPGEDQDLLFYHLPEDAEFGFLQPAFQPYFPEWQRTFAPVQPAIRPGLYIFKASLDPRFFGSQVWRRLAVPDQVTLHGLSLAVLDAFKFDDTEHLYEFRYRDQLGKTRVYNHPYTDEGPYADEISLGETGLTEHQVLQFRFDYGDDWRFVLRLVTGVGPEQVPAPEDVVNFVNDTEQACSRF